MEKRTTKRKPSLMIFYNCMEFQALAKQYQQPIGKPIECWETSDNNQFILKTKGIEVTATITQNFELY